MVYSSLALDLLSETLSLVAAMVIIVSGVMATAYAASMWQILRDGARSSRWLSLSP